MTKIKQTLLIAIAMAAHEINRAYCESLGDTTVPAWADAPEAQKNSIISGVEMHLDSPDTTPEQAHESWLARKTAEGWVYGEVKDLESKQHPCCLPYEQLPAEQKAKDYIFRGAVHSVFVVLNDGVSEAVGEAIAGMKIQMEQAAGQATAMVQAVTQPIKPSLPDGHVVVEYIGRKDSWTDTLYGSKLTFVKSQKRAVNSVLAGQFLRHVDMFKVAEPDEVIVQSVQQQADNQDDTNTILEEAEKQAQLQRDQQAHVEDVRDQVNLMNEQSLKDFALNKYQQKLHPALKLENMRSKVLGLIDQFGVV